MRKYDVYLAGPFFNDEQKAIMDKAKRMLERYEISVADPRELGPIIKERALSQDEMKEIFDGNISAIENSSCILANYDSKDVGTAFEVGFALARGIPVVGFSLSNAKTNVMLAFAFSSTCKNEDELEAAISGQIFLQRAEIDE